MVGSNFPTSRRARYVLQASRHRSARWNEGESSTQFVTVNGVDVADLAIRTATGRRSTAASSSKEAARSGRDS
jgi:hypothetical protein